MLWFQRTAPIRLKLLVAFSIMTALAAFATLGAAIGWVFGVPAIGVAAGLAATIAAGVMGLWFRTAIADPYVTTVVRMEALAVGDLDAPIAFTDYTDCVGRLTKAMFTFRNAAVAQNRHAAEQVHLVDTLRSHLAMLKQGDLTAAIRETFPPVYESLKTDYNAALDQLRGLIGAVTQSAATIQTETGDIAQVAENLARRTQTDAASLEVTASSITQMEGRLKATAAAATRTVERADQATATVGSGRAVADEAVQAMGRVSESAKGIDSVIEGLDKIAFQTRVLAMNAAVEAGRAGEAGRGFAVVADLVSALAMRAEEEAKRARDQLTVTQSEVVTAVEAVQKVDGALADISGDVGQVHELLAGMAADNQAQSSAITEISSAIGTMDQSTRQNAAMVAETSAAARNLTREVGALAEQAGRFNVGNDGRRSAVQAPSSRPAPAAARSDTNAVAALSRAGVTI